MKLKPRPILLSKTAPIATATFSRQANFDAKNVYGNSADYSEPNANSRNASEPNEMRSAQEAQLAE